MLVMYEALVARVLTPALAWVGAVVIVGVLVALGIRLVRSAVRTRSVAADCPAARELLLFATLPVAVAFVASVTFARSAFVPRYLIVAAPAYLLVVGLAVSRVSLRRPEFVSGAFVLFTLIAGVATKQRGGEKIPWSEIAARIAHSGAGSISAPPVVVTFEGFTAIPLTWYAAESGAPGLRVRGVSSLASLDSIPSAWVVYREGSFSSSSAPQRYLQEHGVAPSDEFRERTLSQEIVGFHFSHAAAGRETAGGTATGIEPPRAAAPTPSPAPSGKTRPDDGR